MVRATKETLLRARSFEAMSAISFAEFDVIETAQSTMNFLERRQNCVAPHKIECPTG